MENDLAISERGAVHPYMFMYKDAVAADWYAYCEIHKSQTADKDGDWIFEGIASTDDLDLQGEKVHQQGIDTTYLEKHGWFNDDHKGGPENKIGEILEVKKTSNGLYVKGRLFKTVERAKHYWDLMTSLTGAIKKRVGMSIQGKVLRRSGSNILASWIQEIALTTNPVNTATYAEIIKSLASEMWCNALGGVCVETNGCKACSLIDTAKSRPQPDFKAAAMSAGYATVNQKDGAALRPESLDDKEKEQKEKSSKQKFLSKADAVTLLQLKRGYSRTAAEKVAGLLYDIVPNFIPKQELHHAGSNDH